jgi:hypothetical protein
MRAARGAEWGACTSIATLEAERSRSAPRSVGAIAHLSELALELAVSPPFPSQVRSELLQSGAEPAALVAQQILDDDDLPVTVRSSRWH